MKNQLNKKLIGIFAIFVFILSLQIISRATALDLLQDIPSNGSYLDDFEQTPEKADGHLYFFDYRQPYGEFKFQSSGNCSIYFVNDTEAGEFLLGNEFTPLLSFINKTGFITDMSFKYITETLNVENKTKHLDTGDVNYVKVYFIVYNENNDPVKINIRIGYQSVFVSFLNDMSAFTLCLGFLILSIILFTLSYKDRKQKEIEKSNILNNYGFGYLTGALLLGLWEGYHWMLDISPESRWKINLNFPVPVEIFSQNILVMLTLFGFGLSIMFMSFTVEKQVQAKNKPIISIILLISSSLLLLGIAIPTTLAFVMIFWIVVLVIANSNIILTYIKVIRQTDGMIRRKTIMVLTGYLSVYLLIALRDFFYPQFIFNFISLISFVVFYYGIK